MKAVRVTYSGGKVIPTRINGTDETILNYFAIGSGESDDMQHVTSAEIIPIVTESIQS